MSALVEKIRLETRLGNFSKVKCLLSTNMRMFASLSKAEQNALLLAMINVQETKLLFSHLGPELDEASIVRHGFEEFRRQLIIALAHMWFGSEALALRIAKRLLSILVQRAIPFDPVDLKRAIESISSIYDAQGDFKSILLLKKFYPQEIIVGAEHTDRYFYRKYYLALCNVKGPTKEIIHKIKEIRDNTKEEMPKLFLFFDLCYMRKLSGELSYTDVVQLFKKEGVFQTVKEKNLNLPSIYFMLTMSEIEKNNLRKAKKYLDIFNGQVKLPVDKIYALTLLFFHFPDSLKVSESVFLWTHYGTKIQRYFAKEQNPYFPLVKKQIAKGNCWYLDNNNFSPRFYKNISTEKNIIDLNAGLLKKNGKLYLLSSKRVRFLISVISQSCLGATEIDLISEVYPEVLAHYAFSKKETLKNLALQLKKMGLPIKKNKGFYYFVFENNTFDIIIPMSLQQQGLHTYCSKKMQQFDSNDLVQLLNIKRTNAFELIKEWKNAKLIHRLSGIKKYTWWS